MNFNEYHEIRIDDNSIEYNKIHKKETEPVDDSAKELVKHSWNFF